MQCPICKKKGMREKGHYTGGFENHNEPKDYYKAEFYCCDLGHEWEIGQEPGKRKKTIIIKETEGNGIISK